MGLSKDWTDALPLNNKEIRRCAFHEVCELLLGNLRDIAGSRFILEREIDEQVHIIIRTLENVIFEKRHREA